MPLCSAQVRTINGLQYLEPVINGGVLWFKLRIAFHIRLAETQEDVKILVLRKGFTIEYKQCQTHYKTLLYFHAIIFFTVIILLSFDQHLYLLQVFFCRTIPI